MSVSRFYSEDRNLATWLFEGNKEAPSSDLIQKVNVSCCCNDCTDILNWKILEGTYIPLKVPVKCSKCEENKVKEAYHTRCSDCSEGYCAKCGESEEIILVVDSIKKREDIAKEIKSKLCSTESKSYLEEFNEEVDRENYKNLADQKHPITSA